MFLPAHHEESSRAAAPAAGTASYPSSEPASPHAVELDAGPPPAEVKAERAALFSHYADDNSDLGDSKGQRLKVAAESSGIPLPGDIRARLERSLRTDLSPVRVHTGAESARAAEAIDAQAYADGSDIHFGPGRFDPQGDAGQALIAHEVAHTVQQRGAPGDLQTKPEVSQPGDAAEVAADHFAEQFMAGETGAVAPVAAGTVSRATIARQPATVNVPPVNITAYDPKLTSTPPTQKAKLGTELSQAVSVSNAAGAEAGTTFQWDWAKLDADKLTAGAAPPPGPRVTLKAKPKKVGEIQAVPELSMTEKDGHQRKKLAPPVSVKVMTPEAQWIVTSSGGNTGKNSAVDLASTPMKLFRNDTLQVDAVISNVDDVQGAGITGSSKAAGHDAGAPASVSKNKVSWKLKMEKPGLQSVTLDVVVPGMEHPLSHSVEVKVVMSVEDVKAKAAATSTLLTAKWHDAAAWLNEATGAFEDAKKKHEQTIKDAGRFGELVGELLMGAFFAGMGGLTGGAVGNVIKGKLKGMDPAHLLQDSAVGGAVTDGGKDVVKFATKALDQFGKGSKGGGAKNAGGGGPGKSAAGGGEQGVGQDPVRWARGISTNLHQEAAELGKQLAELQNACANAEPTDELLLDGDPYESVKNDPFVNTLKDISIHERDYAIGLWQTWIATYGYKVESMSHGPTDRERFLSTDNTRDLFGKLRKGVATQCGPDKAEELFATYMPLAKAKADEEARGKNGDRK